MNTKSTAERQFLYYTLLLARGIGPVAVREIQDAIRFSGLSDDEVGRMLLNKGGLSDLILKEKHDQAISDALSNGARESFLSIQRDGHWVICPSDPVLPSYYWERAEVHRLPSIFIAKGEAPPTDVQWIAVIGSRNADEKGLERARLAGEDNAHLGAITVSGGARGVDSTSTTAAAQAGGWTVTVPSGDVSRSRADAREFVLSPYPPGTRFSPGLAMARNGVVIGLASKVIVAAVNAGTNGKPSGTEDAIDKAGKLRIECVRLHTESNSGQLL